MLRGSQKVKIDQKGRIVIPSIHREHLLQVQAGKQPEPLVITGHPARYAMIMRREVYLKLEKQIVAMPIKDMSAQYFRTTFIGYADDQVVPDQLGRIMIPPTLRSHANLLCKGEAVVFGMHDHLQLWNEGDWESLKTRAAPSGEQYQIPSGWDISPI